MKLSKFVKTPLNVALQKTEVENPLLPRLSFCSKSNVNFKFLCSDFKLLKLNFKL